MPAQVVGSAPALGLIRGLVTLKGRPLSGVQIALIELQSGMIERVVSTATGQFEARVRPGQYVVAAENPAGLAVGRVPTRVALAGGQVVTAPIDLVSMPSQSPPEGFSPSSTVIDHDPVSCMVAGQFPLLDAGIEPSNSVARARVFFKGTRQDHYFYVEMTTVDGRFVGKLPRPRLEVGAVNYYLQATTTALGDAQTPEITAIVVKEAADCPDRKVAAFGPPGDVTVFSAETGAVINPLGFAAGGLTLGTIGLLSLGAAAAGLTTAVTVFNPPTSNPPSGSGSSEPPPSEEGPDTPSQPQAPLPATPFQ